MAAPEARTTFLAGRAALYLHADVDPVVTAGYLPPLAAGFAQVLERPEISRQLEEAVEQEYKEGKQDPYDTHPPLRERLAAAGRALVRGDEQVEVFGLRKRLARSSAEVDAWRAFCERTGVGGDDLGAVAGGD